MQLNQPSYHSFGVEAQNQPGSNPSWMNMKSKAIVVGIVLLGSFALLAAAFNGPAVGENSLDLKSSSPKDICKVKTYAGSVLQRAYESPMFALFEDTKSQTKFETSDIIRAGGNLYAICDSSWAISKLSMSLPNYSPENVQIGNPLQSLDGDTEDSGFEGIFAPPPVDASGNFLPAWDPSKDPLYVVRESIDTSGGADSSDSGDSDSADREYHAVVEKVFLNATDPNVGYSVQESCPTVYQFEGDSKGLEGATMVRGVDGAEYILGLCEGNYCAEGDKGKDRGNGRVIVLKKTEGACSWDTVRLMEIPKSADFQDYSAISISWSGRIAITSQEESQVWIGEFTSFDNLLFDPVNTEFGEGKVYNFPRDDNCEVVYCNIEGIHWINDNMLVAASDKMKKSSQDWRCFDKDQSIHVFVLP